MGESRPGFEPPPDAPIELRSYAREDPGGEHGGVPRVVDADAGDRHAGRHLGDREQRVEAARDRRPARQRHADHRQVAVRGDDAGQRGRQAGAGDDHPQAAHPRVAGVVGDRVRLAVGRHDPDLAADAALGQLLLGGLHRRHVALRAHHDPDERRVDVEPSNSTAGSA